MDALWGRGARRDVVVKCAALRTSGLAVTHFGGVSEAMASAALGNGTHIRCDHKAGPIQKDFVRKAGTSGRKPPGIGIHPRSVGCMTLEAFGFR